MAEVLMRAKQGCVLVDKVDTLNKYLSGAESTPIRPRHKAEGQSFQAVSPNPSTSSDRSLPAHMSEGTLLTMFMTSRAPFQGRDSRTVMSFGGCWVQAVLTAFCVRPTSKLQRS